MPSFLQTHPWRDVCLINDKATLSCRRANLSLAALGKNLFLSILLHASATCQVLSRLCLWSFGISCEVVKISWEGWCAPVRVDVMVWSGKETGAWGLSEPPNDLLSNLGQLFLNTGGHKSCLNLLKTMNPLLKEKSAHKCYLPHTHNSPAHLWTPA